MASGAAAQQMGATNSTNRPVRLGAGPPITPAIRPRAPGCVETNEPKDFPALPHARRDLCIGPRLLLPQRLLVAAQRQD